jgi:hypothetical protein
MEAGETGADTFDDLIADNTVDFEERSDMFGVTVIDGVDFDDESVSFLAVVGGPIESSEELGESSSSESAEYSAPEYCIITPHLIASIHESRSSLLSGHIISMRCGVRTKKQKGLRWLVATTAISNFMTPLGTSALSLLK